MKAAIKKVTGSEESVKIMIVLCNKKVNQRFFKPGARLSNPFPGTVIDQDIVSHDSYDFYMISTTSR